MLLKGRRRSQLKTYKLWNIVAIGKLMWQMYQKKDIFWVKWVLSIYMKDGEDFWAHVPPQDYNWYWKQLNKIKLGIQSQYHSNRYQLTESVLYSISKSYFALLSQRPTQRGHELVWSRVLLPKHRFLTWLAMKGKLLTKERMLRFGWQCDNTNWVLCDRMQVEHVTCPFVNCNKARNMCTLHSRWLGVQSLIEESMCRRGKSLKF